MEPLVLGGSVFVGGEIVDQALARSRCVTVCNRGRVRAAWLPETIDTVLDKAAISRHDDRRLRGKLTGAGKAKVVAPWRARDEQRLASRIDAASTS